MERFLNLNPTQLEELILLLEQLTQLNTKNFWPLYLRKWFKNYDKNRDPYLEYERIMDNISEDPSKIFHYGQKPYIAFFRERELKSRKLKPSKRQEVMSLVFLLEMPPAEIIRLCDEEFQEICGKGNRKFWINYYKRWLLIDPYPIENHYQKLEEIMNVFHENPLFVFRGGSDKFIQEFLNGLDTFNKDILDRLLVSFAQYGRLNWLKWLWETYKDEVDIHAYNDMAFRRAAENGHLEVLKWLWKMSDGSINIHAVNDYAFRWAAAKGHLKVIEWLNTL